MPTGVVLAVLLGALSDLVTVISPDALRGKQAFMLGSTSFLGWSAVALMAAGLVLLIGLALRHARALDALTLDPDAEARVSAGAKAAFTLMNQHLDQVYGCA